MFRIVVMMLSVLCIGAGSESWASTALYANLGGRVSPSTDGCNETMAVTERRLLVKLSCEGREAVASAEAFQDGLVFGVDVTVQAATFSSFNGTANARAQIRETFIPLGASGPGTLVLAYETSCTGGNFAYSEQVRFSVSSGETTLSNRADLPCIDATSRTGVLSLPFEFGVTLVTVMLDSEGPFGAGLSLDSFGRRSGRGIVEVLDGRGRPVSTATLAPVPVPEPGTLLKGVCGLLGILALRNRRARPVAGVCADLTD